MNSWIQGKWEADLRREECHWGHQGGDMRAWQGNWEGKPGREGVERLRFSGDQRESLILGLGFSWAWEEDWVQKPSEWSIALVRDWSGNRVQEEKVEGHWAEGVVLG